jgi:hypothetical protein
MNDITPGTPCYLVDLADYEYLNGRVVEVIGPYPTPADECGQWFAYCADWTRYVFPQGREFIVGRCNLRPITPPPHCDEALKRVLVHEQQ